MEQNDPNKPNTASKKVLDKIRSQQLTMRPRLYFTLKSIALAVVAILTLLLTVSIGSFILFSIRTSYETSLLGFGPSGLLIFLQLFPWALFMLDIACIVLLEWMLRKFRFGYRSPLLYLLFGILVIILSATSVIDTGRFSDSVLRGAHDIDIPIVGDFYESGRRPPSPGSGVCPCVVVAINGNVLTMQENIPNELPKQVTVVLPAGAATSSIHVGQSLFIAGTFDHGTLHAFGTRPMDGDNDADDGGPSPQPSQPQQP
jgi:hypothetical protein